MFFGSLRMNSILPRMPEVKHGFFDWRVGRADYALLCHGMAKRTLSSEVFGIIKAFAPAEIFYRKRDGFPAQRNQFFRISVGH